MNKTQNACLTPIALDALRAARDFGSPWDNQHGGSLVWSASRQRMINRLRDMGFLSDYKVTEMGLAILDGKAVFKGLNDEGLALYHNVTID